MYRISVAGTGYVGLVAGVCFAEVFEEISKGLVGLPKFPKRGQSPAALKT